MIGTFHSLVEFDKTYMEGQIDRFQDPANVRSTKTVMVVFTPPL